MAPFARMQSAGQSKLCDHRSAGPKRKPGICVPAPSPAAISPPAAATAPLSKKRSRDLSHNCMFCIGGNAKLTEIIWMRMSNGFVYFDFTLSHGCTRPKPPNVTHAPISRVFCLPTPGLAAPMFASMRFVPPVPDRQTLRVCAAESFGALLIMLLTRPADSPDATCVRQACSGRRVLPRLVNPGPSAAAKRYARNAFCVLA